MFYNALDSFTEREIGMKKIYLLLFLCACITSCGRVNENDMKQIPNSTQETQTNKDRIFSIEDRVYTSQKRKSKWWNIHYPKLEGEKTEPCNKIILSHIKKLMGEIDLKQEVAITLNYDVKTQTDKILSVLFTGDYYAKGAVHPINVSFSVNYDWEKNRELLLKDVIIESDEFMTKCKKAVFQQCGKEFQEAFGKLSDERIKEQIFEQEDQFYLEDGDINVRLAIPAGSYYYQYVKVEKAHYKN